jgi:bis(5'-nucleosyl)-tetraphosphatase (symmetrical)
VRWVVGDLQGCAAELEELLREIDFDPGRDELWAAGDLVNRGPESAATVRLWRDVGGRGVLGNHEVYALCAHSGRWPRKKDTLQELYDAPDADELLELLRALPILVHLPAVGDGPDAWLVHAGLHPNWTDLPAVARRLNPPPHDDDWLNSDDVGFATKIRCCDPKGKRLKFDGEPALCPPPFLPWDDFYDGDALIVHGHWARRGHYRGPRTLGLDSGCVYGGPLTAWCQDEDRIVQVHL